MKSAELGTSVDDFVRAAIEEKLKREASTRAKTALELWDEMGVDYDSGQTDRSERIEEISRERLGAENHRR